MVCRIPLRKHQMPILGLDLILTKMDQAELLK